MMHNDLRIEVDKRGLHCTHHMPLPPLAPDTITLRCATDGLRGGNRSKHAKAVSVTSGTAAASTIVQHLGFRAIGALSDTARYCVIVPWAA